MHQNHAKFYQSRITIINSLKQKKMKQFINQTIKEKKNNGETPAISFETTDMFGDAVNIGHIQWDNKWNEGEWAIWFNCKCVHVSKTLNSAVNKLEKLLINESHFIED